MNRAEVIAFTGARAVPAGADALVRSVALTLAAGTYVTGACLGVDQMVASLVAEHWPRSTNRIVVPRNRSRVDEVWLTTLRAAKPRTTQALAMPRGTTYRDRNLALLGLGEYDGVPTLRPNLLIGFPLHAERHPDSIRSGTWMTVRMARRAGIRTVVYVLGGDPGDRVGDPTEVDHDVDVPVRA